MTIYNTFYNTSKFTALVLAGAMATSTLAHAQSIDWRKDIVVNKTSKKQNRITKGNFDFPGLYKSNQQIQSFSDINCRSRSARDRRAGTSPIIENE